MGYDLIEDDIPRFARPCGFLDVEDFVVLFVVKTEQFSQRLLLSGSQGKVLFLAHYGFPGQECAFFQPIHKKSHGIIQTTFKDILLFKEIMGGYVGVEFPTNCGWLLGRLLFLLAWHGCLAPFRSLRVSLKTDSPKLSCWSTATS